MEGFYLFIQVLSANTLPFYLQLTAGLYLSYNIKDLLYCTFYFMTILFWRDRKRYRYCRKEGYTFLLILLETESQNFFDPKFCKTLVLC